MVEKIVVTGMGIVSPLGQGIEANWESVVGSGHRACPELNLNGFDRARELASWAASEALTNAGLWDGQMLQGVNHERIGCTVSASKPFYCEEPSPGLRPPSPEKGEGKPARPPSPFSGEGWGEGASWVSPDWINHFIRCRFNLAGESRNVIAACATGAYSIALGAMWIE